jgi:hypothetical protein
MAGFCFYLVLSGRRPGWRAAVDAACFPEPVIESELRFFVGNATTIMLAFAEGNERGN